MKKHETHTEVLARLKRAEGHLKLPIAMIETDRECLDELKELAKFLS